MILKTLARLRLSVIFACGRILAKNRPYAQFRPCLVLRESWSDPARVVRHSPRAGPQALPIFEHRRTVMFGDQEQRLHRGLPFWVAKAALPIPIPPALRARADQVVE